MINIFNKKKTSTPSFTSLPRLIDVNATHFPVEQNFTTDLKVSRGITRFKSSGIQPGKPVLSDIMYFVSDEDISKLPKLDNDKKVLQFLSEDIKVVVRIASSYYHFINDILSSILTVHAVDPDILFILDTSNVPEDILRQPYLSFLPKALTKAGVKFEIHMLSDYDFVDVRNTLSQSYYDTGTMDSIENIHNLYTSFVDNKNIKPFRKVFVSRRDAGERRNNNDPENKLSWNNDKRIDSHDELEDLFRELGFEIVYAERFKTFEEQIQFFYETKVLAGTTGAGLTNAIFMQSGQTVIELQTPLMITLGNNMQQELHFFYTIVSFRRNHNHLMIPNFSRLTSDIKKKLNKDTFLKAFLERG